MVAEEIEKRLLKSINDKSSDTEIIYSDDIIEYVMIVYRSGKTVKLS